TLLAMHCTDDRGKSVRLVPQRQLSIMPGMPSPIPMDARSRMFAEAQAAQWSREGMIPLLVYLVLVAAWGGVWVVLAPRVMPLVPGPPMLRALVMGIAPFLLLPLLMYAVIRGSRRRTCRIIVRHGYCASCGYPLREIAAAPDGCTVCPECGSAWRIGTPASPTSVSPPAIAAAPPTNPR
ncbi:MAG: hypothetical protein KF869_07640, partial [Phycisphaeraceae bacterium]|nr:hypothetical protein [Phycisphaeraceae bacterium]